MQTMLVNKQYSAPFSVFVDLSRIITLHHTHVYRTLRFENNTGYYVRSKPRREFDVLVVLGVGVARGVRAVLVVIGVFAVIVVLVVLVVLVFV